MISRERRVEQAISEFEAKKKRLFRADGSKVYGEAEHAERMAALVSELHEETDREIQGAEQEALGLSYVDPTKGLTVTDRKRFSATLPLVRDDWPAMSLAALMQRLRAVAAAPIGCRRSCTRGASTRVETEYRRLENLARCQGDVPPEDARLLRKLRAVVSELEGQTEGEERARRRAAAEEAAGRYRKQTTKLRKQRSEVDGSDERVQEYRAQMRSTI